MKGETFDAFIAYIDEQLGISYLQLAGESKENFDNKMASVNKYYALTNRRANTDKDYETLNTLLNESQNIICFAKYSDNLWYRAKILKKLANQNSVIQFINFLFLSLPYDYFILF